MFFLWFHPGPGCEYPLCFWCVRHNNWWMFDRRLYGYHWLSQLAEHILHCIDSIKCSVALQLSLCACFGITLSCCLLFLGLEVLKFFDRAVRTHRYRVHTCIFRILVRDVTCHGCGIAWPEFFVSETNDAHALREALRKLQSEPTELRSWEFRDHDLFLGRTKNFRVDCARCRSFDRTSIHFN